MAIKRRLVMSDKPVQVHEVFYAYQEPGLVTEEDSTWIRFDLEFVRIMNEEKITAQDLAKSLCVKWKVLNSPSHRRNDPKWMTPAIIGAMHRVGFDVEYVIFNQKKLKPEESALIANYRSSTPDNQRVLRDVGTALAEPKLIVDADGTYEDVWQRNKW
jgi:hypothetical protein